jgi:hypothetical protein
LKVLWQRLFAPELKIMTEVERIGVLQQAAADRRAEYANKKEQAALAGDAALSGLLPSSRKRMEDAEAAHIAALQKWQNKQARQNSY